MVSERDEDLRLDYSVECEECGNVMDIPRMIHPSKIQQNLRVQGWRLIDDSNHCPACARSATTTTSAQDPMLAQPNPPPED